jgi:TRAP-type C4-dicarboxylate transport system permease small subunit
MDIPKVNNRAPPIPWILKPAELSSYGFAICVAIIGYEVVMRYGFNAPRIWVQDMVVMLVGGCFAIGGIVVLYEGSHIRITAIYDNVPRHVQRGMDLLAALVASSYLALISYGAWINARLAIALNETTGTSWDSPLPMVLKTILLVSASVMCVIAVMHVYRSIKRLIG